MEEKVIKILEEKIQTLEQEREEIEKNIDKLKGELEFRDGKLENSLEQKELENDLHKIELEIKMSYDEKKSFEKWISTKEQANEEVNENKKKKESLSKDEKQCKEAIAEIEGKYDSKDGKLSKPGELIEYENDLQKIQSEIEALDNSIKKKERKIVSATKNISKIIEKYGKQIERRDAEAYDRDWEEAIKENERRDAEAYDRDWEEAIKENERRDAEAYDRDWEEAIKENERRDAEAYDRDWEEAIRENERRDAEAYSMKLEPFYAISIGKEAEITYNGETYKVSSRKTDKGYNLKQGKTEKMIYKWTDLEQENSEKVNELLSKGKIDPVVINAIARSKMPREDKKIVMQEYITDCWYGLTKDGEDGRPKWETVGKVQYVDEYSETKEMTVKEKGNIFTRIKEAIAKKYKSNKLNKAQKTLMKNKVKAINLQNKNGKSARNRDNKQGPNQSDINRLNNAKLRVKEAWEKKANIKVDNKDNRIEKVANSKAIEKETENERNEQEERM